MIVFDNDSPSIQTQADFHWKCNRTKFFSDALEDLPTKYPMPHGDPIKVTEYVDLDHPYNYIINHSITGIMILSTTCLLFGFYNANAQFKLLHLVMKWLLSILVLIWLWRCAVNSITLVYMLNLPVNLLVIIFQLLSTLPWHPPKTRRNIFPAKLCISKRQFLLVLSALVTFDQKSMELIY